MLLFILPALTLISCAGGNTIQKNTTVVPAPENMCDRTVKYSFEKFIKTSEAGLEKEERQKIELTINPADGKITQKMVGSESSEETTLTQKHCSLTANMKSGEALYEIIHKYEQEEGGTTESIFHFRVAATDGIVQLSVSAPGKNAGVKVDVSHWELVD